MSKYTDEEVFDIVQKALLKAACSEGELHAGLNFIATTEQVDDALDVLEEVGALNERQEPRPYNDGKNHRLIPVYEIRSECQTKNIMREYRATLV